ncbi:MAG: tetratricopeptide repeat protein, partial [Acidobacteriota bacterium]
MRKACSLLVAAICFALPAWSGLTAENPKDLAGEYRRAVRLGESRWREGQFEEAFAWYSQARELSERMKDSEQTVRCLTRLGRLCWAIGKPEESRKYYEEALTRSGELNVAKDAEESRVSLKVLGLYSQGKSDRLAGRPEKALQNLFDGFELARKLGRPELEVKCLRQLSLAHWDKQDWKVYVDLNTQALQNARELRDQREQARCMLNLAGYYFHSDSFEEALDSYSAALDISRELKDKTMESSCLKSMGVILMQLGYYERSLDYLLAAYEIDKQSENSPFFYQSLNILAEAFHSRGLIFSNRQDLYGARDFFTQVLEAAREIGDKRTEMVAANNLGHLNFDLEKYHAALHYLESAFRLAAGTQDLESAREISNNIGLCWLKLGNYETAQKFFFEALNLEGRTSPNRILWETVYHLGESYEKQQAYERALTCYRNSIEAIEYLRSRIPSEEYKSGFGRDKIKVYESLISLLFSLKTSGRSEDTAREIFEVAERAKARSFLESLGNIGKDKVQKPDPALQNQEREISRLITAVISELEKKNLPPKRRQELSQRLRQAEEQYIGLTSRSGPKNAEFPDAALARTIRVEEVQERLLDEKTTILEFLLGERQSYVFLVTQNSFRIFPLPPRAVIEKSLFAYLQLLSTPPQGPWRGLAAGQRLSRELLADALTVLPGSVENLIIVP